MSRSQTIQHNQMTEDTSVFLSDEALGGNVLSAQMKVLKGYSSR